MRHREQTARRHFNYSNVMSTLAVFLVIAGGSALAAALPANSVRSKTVKDNALKSQDLKDGKAVKGIDVADGSLDGADIANESLTSDDLATNSVDGGEIVAGAVDTEEVENNGLLGADVTDNTLTGADINESTLGQVPSALLGGLGRTGAESSCDPESATFIGCAATEVINVPTEARALILARVGAQSEAGADDGIGDCRLWHELDRRCAQHDDHALSRRRQPSG